MAFQTQHRPIIDHGAIVAALDMEASIATLMRDNRGRTAGDVARAIGAHVETVTHALHRMRRDCIVVPERLRTRGVTIWHRADGVRT